MAGVSVPWIVTCSGPVRSLAAECAGELAAEPLLCLTVHHSGSSCPAGSAPGTRPDTAAATRTHRRGRQLAHPREWQWEGKERDNAAALAGQLTLRYGWWQVHRQVCQTAAQVAAVLRTRGREGSPKPCPETCVTAEGGLPGDAYPEARATAGLDGELFERLTGHAGRLTAGGQPPGDHGG